MKYEKQHFGDGLHAQKDPDIPYHVILTMEKNGIVEECITVNLLELRRLVKMAEE